MGVLYELFKWVASNIKFLRPNLLLPIIRFVIALIIGISSAVFYYLITLRGPGYSVDSVHYLSAAESFFERGRFLQVDGQTPAHMWPPGFPFMLSLPKFLGFEIVSAFCVVQTLFFAGFLYFIYRFLQMRGHPRFVIIWGLVLSAFSYANLNVLRMLWSESPFVPCQLAIVYFLYRFVEERNRKWFYLAAFFTSMSPLFRFAGVASIILGCLVMLTDKGEFKERFKNSFIFGFLASIPLVGYFVWSKLINGEYSGVGSVFRMHWLDYLHEMLDRTGRYFFPLPNGLLYFVILGGVGYYLGRKKFKDLLYPYRIELYFYFIYVAFLLISSELVHIEAPGIRYMDPIHFYLLLPTLAVLYSVSNKNWGKVLVAILIAHNLFQFYEKAKQTYREGMGFNQDQYSSSPLVDWVNKNKPQMPIYSNMGELVYLYNKIRPFYSGADCLEISDKIAAHGSALYVWFTPSTRPSCDPELLSSRVKMEPLAVFAEGGIYQLINDRNARE